MDRHTIPITAKLLNGDLIQVDLEEGKENVIWFKRAASEILDVPTNAITVIDPDRGGGDDEPMADYEVMTDHDDKMYYIMLREVVRRPVARYVPPPSLRDDPNEVLENRIREQTHHIERLQQEIKTVMDSDLSDAEKDMQTQAQREELFETAEQMTKVYTELFRRAPNTLSDKENMFSMIREFFIYLFWYYVLGLPSEPGWTLYSARALMGAGGLWEVLKMTQLLIEIIETMPVFSREEQGYVSQTQLELQASYDHMMDIVERSGTSECSLCYRRYTYLNPKVYLPECGHSFHQECLDRLFHSQLVSGQPRRCPLCMSAVQGHHQRKPIAGKLKHSGQMHHRFPMGERR